MTYHKHKTGRPRIEDEVKSNCPHRKTQRSDYKQSAWLRMLHQEDNFANPAPKKIEGFRRRLHVPYSVFLRLVEDTSDANLKNFTPDTADFEKHGSRVRYKEALFIASSGKFEFCTFETFEKWSFFAPPTLLRTSLTSSPRNAEYVSAEVYGLAFLWQNRFRHKLQVEK